MPSVRFATGVSAVIGFTSLSRETKLRVYSEIVFELESHIAAYVNDRVPDRPDCFRFDYVCVERGMIHTFIFHIWDGDPNCFLVVEAHHVVGPIS